MQTFIHNICTLHTYTMLSAISSQLTNLRDDDVHLTS